MKYISVTELETYDAQNALPFGGVIIDDDSDYSLIVDEENKILYTGKRVLEEAFRDGRMFVETITVMEALRFFTTGGFEGGF